MKGLVQEVLFQDGKISLKLKTTPRIGPCQQVRWLDVDCPFCERRTILKLSGEAIAWCDHLQSIEKEGTGDGDPSSLFLNVEQGD